MTFGSGRAMLLAAAAAAAGAGALTALLPELPEKDPGVAVEAPLSPDRLHAGLPPVIALPVELVVAAAPDTADPDPALFAAAPSGAAENEASAGPHPAEARAAEPEPFRPEATAFPQPAPAAEILRVIAVLPPPRRGFEVVGVRPPLRPSLPTLDGSDLAGSAAAGTARTANASAAPGFAAVEPPSPPLPSWPSPFGIGAGTPMAEPVEGRAIGTGLASWYGPGFHGRRTASGEIFNQHAMTAAHRSLPFGTRVRVVDDRTGRSVVVRINDRGPFKRSRVIDLSRASAEALGVAGGLARVRIVSAE